MEEPHIQSALLGSLRSGSAPLTPQIVQGSTVLRNVENLRTHSRVCVLCSVYVYNGIKEK